VPPQGLRRTAQRWSGLPRLHQPHALRHGCQRRLPPASADSVVALLASAAIAYEADVNVYAGGTTCLPGLDVCICLGEGFNEIETPCSRGSVVGRGAGDPTTDLFYQRRWLEAFTRPTT